MRASNYYYSSTNTSFRAYPFCLPVFVITDNPKLALGIDHEPLIIPSNGPLTALIAVLPLQLIAYELAILR